MHSHVPASPHTSGAHVLGQRRGLPQLPWQTVVFGSGVQLLASVPPSSIGVPVPLSSTVASLGGPPSAPPPPSAARWTLPKSTPVMRPQPAAASGTTPNANPIQRPGRVTRTLPQWRGRLRPSGGGGSALRALRRSAPLP